jgi:hypothetical protein
VTGVENRETEKGVRHFHDSGLVRLGGRSEQDWFFGFDFLGDMSVEGVTCGKVTQVTQSHTKSH